MDYDISIRLSQQLVLRVFLLLLPVHVGKLTVLIILVVASLIQGTHQAEIETAFALLAYLNHWVKSSLPSEQTRYISV